jgi:hypothetical protein
MRCGRFVCRSCAAEALDGIAPFDSLYAVVIRRAADVLGMKPAPPALSVAPASNFDPDRLVDEMAAERLSGLYERGVDGEASILILTPQTPTRATAVLAHELAHAWQAQNCPDAQGVRIREGFAEWVAWKLLEGLPGGEGERARIAARTDDYGTGFRIFRGIEERRGIPDVLWYARAARRGTVSGPEGSDVAN